MRITTLRVENFRAIELFEVKDLSDFVMIAGQNGCGKSCVFDAIRLMKSAYGGYQANEFSQWLGEFSINPSNPLALSRMFRDPKLPLSISASLSFSEQENLYIHANAKELAFPIAMQRVTNNNFDPNQVSKIAMAAQYQQMRPILDPIVEEVAGQIRHDLGNPEQQLSILISPSGDLTVTPNVSAMVAFQANEPEHIGVIDFHSASRSYSRQDVGGVNLDAKFFDDQRRQQRLYNWQAKYQNVKNELASAYLRSLVAEKAGDQIEEDLNTTLVELFHTFFPNKKYLGVLAQTGGSLSFPIELPSGRTHDIDELSSGEKEILYGYLRLKNSTPRGSILLLDEPELHLNPGLLAGFADFYNEHLGVAMGNQIWMVTHSDTLLRQSVGKPDYRAYHMVGASSDDSGRNQATHILIDDDLDRATLALVGDLAAYKPESKVVILEGDDGGEFDATVISRLFPDFAKSVNLVSGGNKRRVRDLHNALSNSVLNSSEKSRFYAITDRDYDEPSLDAEGTHRFEWDRYHIENYLLDDDAIFSAINRTNASSLEGPSLVAEALRDCARELTPDIVRELVGREINSKLVSTISMRPQSKDGETSELLSEAVKLSAENLALVSRSYTADEIQSLLEDKRVNFVESLDSDGWRSLYPGRRILRGFVGKHVKGIAYPQLISLILDIMSENGVKPAGIESVIRRISTI